MKVGRRWSVEWIQVGDKGYPWEFVEGKKHMSYVIIETDGRLRAARGPR